MTQVIYALVDCNNFFVSCERVFQPWLRNVPVAVLSNNDGCIVARSNEVKKLQIPMGAPVFKYKEIIRKNKIYTLSSNFTLYSDMSKRVMECLSNLTDKIQIYSIDEAFLSLSPREGESFESLGKRIRHTVYKETGIPVSVGIGSTKTLAKLANGLSKKNPQFQNVLSFVERSEQEIDQLLSTIPVGDVWGVGYRSVKKFQELGVDNARDLKYLDTEALTHLRGVVGYRMQLELRGVVCYELDSMPEPRKSIACTRSFGKKIDTFEELKQAVVSYASNACEKLRRQRSVAMNIYVFAHTNWHQQYEKYYYNGIDIKLPKASSDTRDFVKAAIRGLRKIYVPGLSYKKAGVYITKILPYSAIQLDLFLHDEKKWEEQLQFLGVIDRLNQKWGHGMIKLAAEGTDRKWSMKREHLSSRFTTKWEELPIVR